MSRRFEELDVQPTRMIDVSRRRDPTTGDDVFEVLLGEEFLMSSLFTVADIVLAGSAWERSRATTSTSRSAASGLEWTVDALSRRLRSRWGADTRRVTP